LSKLGQSVNQRLRGKTLPDQFDEALHLSKYVSWTYQRGIKGTIFDFFFQSFLLFHIDIAN
jgi:hypothetical protein